MFHTLLCFLWGTIEPGYCAQPRKLNIILKNFPQSSQNRLIIKGAKIVNADGMSDGDVFIEDGSIK